MVLIDLKCVGIKSNKPGSNKEGFDNYLSYSQIWCMAA